MSNLPGWEQLVSPGLPTYALGLIPAGWGFAPLSPPCTCLLVDPSKLDGTSGSLLQPDCAQQVTSDYPVWG